MDKEFTFKQKDGQLLITQEIVDELKKCRNKWSIKDIPVSEKPIISRIYNKFFEHYFSPTFVRSYNNCPCQRFIQYFEKKEDSPVLNLGSAVHKVYERIVKDKIKDKKEIENIANEEFKNFNLTKDQISDYKNWVNNFSKFDQYDGKKLFEDGRTYYPEFFLPENNITILGENLGNCMCLIDRLDLDVEKKEIVIIDYKTGHIISSLDKIIEKYRTQMITYDWVTQLNFPNYNVKVYLYSPEINQYLQVETRDLVSQSKWVEEILDFYDDRESSLHKNGFLTQKENQYCKYCSLYGNCSALCKQYDKEIKRKLEYEEPPNERSKE